MSVAPAKVTFSHQTKETKCQRTPRYQHMKLSRQTPSAVNNCLGNENLRKSTKIMEHLRGSITINEKSTQM